MLVKMDIDPKTPLTADELEMLRAAEKHPISFDEDCPELSSEELAKFRRVSEIRREERNKQTVTLRLSPQALKKARSLGKGYTSVLSRILESALRDNETIKNFL